MIIPTLAAIKKLCPLWWTVLNEKSPVIIVRLLELLPGHYKDGFLYVLYFSHGE